MSNATLALELTRAAVAILGALDRAGVNSRRVQDLFEQSRASGQPITDEQIQQIADDAQSAIDRIGGGQ